MYVPKTSGNQQERACEQKLNPEVYKWEKGLQIHRRVRWKVSLYIRSISRQQHNCRTEFECITLCPCTFARTISRSRFAYSEVFVCAKYQDASITVRIRSTQMRIRKGNLRFCVAQLYQFWAAIGSFSPPRKVLTERPGHGGTCFSVSSS